jgi:hypothetical protein
MLIFMLELELELVLCWFFWVDRGGGAGARSEHRSCSRNFGID